MRLRCSEDLDVAPTLVWVTESAEAVEQDLSHYCWSRVGFDRDFTRAAVIESTVHPTWANNREAIFLRRTTDGWQVEAATETWFGEPHPVTRESRGW